MIQEKKQLLHVQEKTSIKRRAIKGTGIPQHKQMEVPRQLQVSLLYKPEPI